MLANGACKTFARQILLRLADRDFQFQRYEPPDGQWDGCTPGLRVANVEAEDFPRVQARQERGSLFKSCDLPRPQAVIASSHHIHSTRVSGPIIG